MARRILCIALCLMVPVFCVAQEPLKCADELALARKHLVVLRSSREQLEGHLAALLARLDAAPPPGPAQPAEKAAEPVTPPKK